jgi:hypothetical protein
VAVGVPEITPVADAIAKPAGSVGETVNVREVPKPVTVYAVVAVIAVPTRAMTTCGVGDNAVDPVTVSVIVAVAATTPSDAVTVCTVLAWAAVGVPDTTPVVALKLKPAGSDGTMENDFVRVNSASVYAVVAVIAVPTVAVTVWVAGEMLGAADTIDDPAGTATTPARARDPEMKIRLAMDVRDDMRCLLVRGHG